MFFFIIFSVFSFAILIIIPILTIQNIISLTPKKGIIKNRRAKDIFTILFGFLLSILCVGVISTYHYDEPVILGGDEIILLHEPFSSDYIFSLFLYAAVPIVCLLTAGTERLLPPLVGAFCIGGIYGGIILCFFYSVQLIGGAAADSSAVIFVAFLLIYVLNFILIAVRIISDNVKKYLEYFREKDITPRSAFGAWLICVLSRASGWAWFPLICLIPVTGALVILCVIFGQGPWGIIKAFTETSDWTYSTMVSPPPENYEGHYLCTVAVNGHERLVKPTRMGIRHGVRIGVNRQLCAANAFEQIIEEKAPHFHRLVRLIYDTYGYPLSRHITTRLRADIVYIAMKPLEYIFLLVLYLTDESPESRIALQYTGKNIKCFTEEL